MRKQFAKSDIKSFLNVVSFAQDIMTKKSDVVREDDCLYVDGELACICSEGEWYPSLRIMLKKPDLLPTVTVDKGAIRFVVNGADVMRPGITKADEFPADSFVLIVDEHFAKPLAVGKALFSSTALLAKTSGKVIKTLHVIGDDYWTLSQ